MTGRRLLVCLSSALLIFPQGAWAACLAGGPDNRNYQAELARIGQIMEAAVELRRLIDRSAFDLDAVLEKTDYEAENIVAFVKRGIAFEQYPGTLRGPEGTLMSRAGNALDQSLLLAKLLRDSGHDARIARATLDHDGAGALLREMQRPKPPEPPIGPADQIAEVLETLGALTGGDAGRRAGLLEHLAAAPRADQYPGYDEVLRTASFLEGRLASARIRLGADFGADLLKEAADYFWVQYRDSAASGWSDLHPAFLHDPPFQPAVQAVFVDQVPEDLHHKLSFQVFIERLQGDRLEVIPLTQPWIRPTANMNAVPLAFANLPNTLTAASDSLEDIIQAVSEASWFAPVLGSAVAPGAGFFDRRGTLIDPLAAGSAAAGVIDTVGGLFGRALGELGERGGPVLTAQWLEFSLISPNGEQRRHRRTTFDRIGAAARLANKAPATVGPNTNEDLRTLLQRHTFMVATGETPRALAVDAALQALLELRPVLDAMVDEAAGRNGSSDRLQRLMANAESPWMGHLTLFTQLDRAADLGGKHRVYRPAPSLVVHSDGLSRDAGHMQAIDIVQNPWRAIVLEGDVPTIDAAAALRAGVWETALEGILLGNSTTRRNIGAVLEEARQAGVALKLLGPSDTTAALELGADTLAAVQADLDRGFAVLIPSRRLPGGMGWWRVNPSTGETLGQIDDGRGSELLQYASLLTSVGLGVVGAIGCSVEKSRSSERSGLRNARFACCVTQNAVMFGLGLLIANVVVAVAWDVGTLPLDLCNLDK